jgi:hypothetical protein
MSIDRSVTASFALVQETLTVGKSGRGAGTVTSTPAAIACGSTCSDQFPYGTSITLLAQPRPDARFTGWSGSCSGRAACALTMAGARSVTAQFDRVCVVPKVTGKKLSRAQQLIRRSACRVGSIRRAYSAKLPRGRVVAQHPRHGRRLPLGSKVSLVLSRGKRPKS